MKADRWETSLFLVSWLVVLPDPLWNAGFPLGEGSERVPFLPVGAGKSAEPHWCAV